MSESKENKTYDPFEAWRGMRDASMDAWAKAMVQAVNTEAYAKASGAMLDAYLTASIPFREMLEKPRTTSLRAAPAYSPCPKCRARRCRRRRGWRRVRTGRGQRRQKMTGCGPP
jgi:hypothetical protein